MQYSMLSLTHMHIYIYICKHTLTEQRKKRKSVQVWRKEKKKKERKKLPLCQNSTYSSYCKIALPLWQNTYCKMALPHWKHITYLTWWTLCCHSHHSINIHQDTVLKLKPLSLGWNTGETSSGTRLVSDWWQHSSVFRTLSVQYTGTLFLPLSVRHSSSLSSFKSKLKTHLSSEYWSGVFFLLSLPTHHW